MGKVKADGVNLLEPECFVTMERFSVPEGREASFVAAAAASGPDAASTPEGFRFAENCTSGVTVGRDGLFGDLRWSLDAETRGPSPRARPPRASRTRVWQAPSHCAPSRFRTHSILTSSTPSNSVTW